AARPPVGRARRRPPARRRRARRRRRRRPAPRGGPGIRRRCIVPGPEQAVAVHVIATAGHVDHGKSALVRALTGMEPDRWEAERRRGMSLDLGFAWTTLPSGQDVAFVDVPGHERFVSTMLAGAGPVPAVMFVVAADEGWMPQSAEHLAAIDALGVRHGILVVSRSDLADPAPALREAALEIAATSLGRGPAPSPAAHRRSPGGVEAV